MAKKRQEEAKKGSPEWMATFSDLMNLLLCFFVLLYSMSTIDAEKFEIIRASLNSNFSILTGAGSAIKEGQFINNGISQLNNLKQYDEEGTEESEQSNQDSGQIKDQEYESIIDDSKAEMSLEESIDRIEEQKKQDTQSMYDNISELMDKNGINTEQVELTVDPEYNYVKILISGSILFSSGSAQLNSNCLPILNKVGDILVVYDNYQIEIEGHTDNVPFVRKGEYEDNDELSSARALSAYRYLINQCKLDPKTFKHSGRGEYDPIASNSTKEGRQKNRRIEIKIYNQLSSY